MKPSCRRIRRDVRLVRKYVLPQNNPPVDVGTVMMMTRD
jgi:hypothetical protein